MKIAAASGKGGTGKTTLSTNLAHYLADRERQILPTDHVILTDLDVEEPNSGLFIQGELTHQEDRHKMIPSWDKGRCSLCGICQQVCNFNAVIKLGDQIMVFPELCHSCYACSELCPDNALPMVPEKMGVLRQIEAETFTFVESKLDIGQEQAVPLIAQTIDYVETHFPENSSNMKIYDSPPGTSCPVIEAVKDVDFVILVTEPTPFGLHDLTLAVDTMRKLAKPHGVVINRYGIGNAGVESYCRNEDIDILARIPNDRRAAELYSRGMLIYKEIPEIAEALEQITRYLEAEYTRKKGAEAPAGEQTEAAQKASSGTTEHQGGTE